jgi:N6-L-threonylcarbamoyladenine synthase
MGEGLILSIESSCDDSSIAITQIETKKLIFHRKISQDAEHSVYGGVVPELASRLHAKDLPILLDEAKEFLPAIKAVAVTCEPGLVISLAEGVAMAKVLSVTLGVPLIGANHLMGHIYSLFIEKELCDLPLSILLVSGGHTQVMEFGSLGDVKTVAKTTDDSFGESFDKCAKMLGIGYPGGPAIEALAMQGDEMRFGFTIPLHDKRLAFSYSGLKNAVRVQIVKLGELCEQDKADIAASFQRVAVEHLLYKLNMIFRENPPKTFAIVGGAAANGYLRAKAGKLCTKYNTTLMLPQLQYCSDNAAMIGRLGADMFANGQTTTYDKIVINSKSHI